MKPALPLLLDRPCLRQFEKEKKAARENVFAQKKTTRIVDSRIETIRIIMMNQVYHMLPQYLFRRRETKFHQKHFMKKEFNLKSLKKTVIMIS